MWGVMYIPMVWGCDVGCDVHTHGVGLALRDCDVGCDVHTHGVGLALRDCDGLSPGSCGDVVPSWDEALLLLIPSPLPKRRMGTGAGGGHPGTGGMYSGGGDRSPPLYNKQPAGGQTRCGARGGLFTERLQDRFNVALNLCPRSCLNLLFS